MSVVGSTMAISRVDREVRRVTTTYSDEDPSELAESIVQMCEEKVLDWMRTRTVHLGSDADPDPAGGPTGQKLFEELEETLAKEEAAKDPPPGSREAVWMRQVLEQATKMLSLAEEVRDTTTKRDWQSCAYHNYRWQMDQEVGHLGALFGGTGEDEVRVKGQRQAKVWMVKAHENVEPAREHIGSRLRKVFGLNLGQHCRHDGPPTESRLCDVQAQAAIQRASRAWGDSPGRIQGLCGTSPGVAGRSIRGMVLVEAPAADSEFPPDLTDSESDSDPSDSEDSDSSGSDTEDSDSSETGAKDSALSDAEMAEQGPLTSDTDNWDSSSTDSEDSDPSSSDSGTRDHPRPIQERRFPLPHQSWRRSRRSREWWPG
jgi:hypothetical protein